MTSESPLFRYYSADKLGMREPRDGEKPVNSDSILRKSALGTVPFLRGGGAGGIWGGSPKKNGL